MALCLFVCVCLSQVGVLSNRLDGSRWVFDGGFDGGFFRKNKIKIRSSGTSSILNCGPRKFRHCARRSSMVGTCCQLSSTQVEAERVINGSSVWSIVYCRFLPLDAMHPRYWPWPCLSVCLSVTSRCSTKPAKRRITQTTPHDSPGTLVS